ncbi:MAG TPA: diacylglycerol kinase family protein [Thermomicrobiales bacterium]|jgi:diacylglycerol kinase
MTQRAESLFASFRYATAGLRYLLVSQRNARVQSGIGVVALALAAILRVSRVEWAIITLLIALVLTLEALNSAIEATVDLVTSDYHPLAKIAKDVAAGAVWLMAIASAVIGAIIFLPPLLALWAGSR